jgi:hypothetical protein
LLGDTSTVALLAFNRPDITRLIFERIRQAKPRILMVIADGPRADHPNDVDSCKAVRYIVEHVNWQCELLKNYSETNLGCGRRVASGLDWVFQNVDEAIILEDDCLPEPGFFPFCAELLARYREDNGVMQISGSNLLFGRRFTQDSYYFSRYPLCWGWATWRRAWRHFDFEMRVWKTDPERCLARFKKQAERAFWRSVWDMVAARRVDTWDYQWGLAVFLANGLAATPSTNLITNLGFGSCATHTRSRLLALRPTATAIKFPLRHSVPCEANLEADWFTVRRVFCQRSMMGKGVEAVRRILLGALSHLRNGDILRKSLPITFFTPESK